MKNTQTINRTHGQTESRTSSEISKVAVTAMSITAGLIGIWAVACMIVGVINNGGPVALIKSLFGAITGTM